MHGKNTPRSLSRKPIQCWVSYDHTGKFFSTSAKRLLYLSLVRSHLYYASEAWSGQSIQITRCVEAVQRKTSKFILGWPRKSPSYKERLLKLNLLPLCYWHEIKDLVFLHGCINGRFDVDIEQYVSFSPQNRLRNSNKLNFALPKTRTIRHLNTAFF